jgi:hypothetical protein
MCSLASSNNTHAIYFLGIDNRCILKYFFKYIKIIFFIFNIIGPSYKKIKTKKKLKNIILQQK